jgi:serine O-acetyltransferase
MHHLRDFRSPAIFEFFNTIGQKMSANPGLPGGVLRLNYRTGVVGGRPYIRKGANAACAGLGEKMIPDGISSGGELWLTIRREAEIVLASDPIFGRSLSAAILDHSDLASAVSYQIGKRLGKSTGDRHLFERAANEAFAASPDLVDAASRDLEWIVLSDPASAGLLPALLNFKGYVALQAWRVSNWLWYRDRRDLALLLQSCSSDLLQVSIHPSASIGRSVYLDHATGIVIGAFAAIGDEVTIQSNVTVGRQAESPNSAPRIGRGVLLSTGATILGDISIGDFAKIGAGAVVTSDVPDGCTAVGVPARLTNCPEGVPA